MTLPPFPVDPATLDLLWLALHPGPEADRTSLWDLLDLLSELGGSDTNAVDHVEGDVQIMRDPTYSDHDVIVALIREVRRLRSV